MARSVLGAFLEDRDAEREARLILSHVTGRSQASLLADADGELGAEAQRRLTLLLDARRQRQPLSQLIGSVEFYGRRFEVSEDVLTPRPDTETLIDIALAAPVARVLDLGTGSGCILATLLAERPGATGLGTDLSEAALAVAERNIGALDFGGRAELRQSDWFGAVDGVFDLIVSNPPYITAEEMQTLAPEVRHWEPQMALTPGGDGLDAYRAILAGMPDHLARSGRLIVEIGYGQGTAVSDLFRAAGLENVTCHADLSGKDRVVSGSRV
ncbi:peptide chain release factor N(5)-glutamine methyltransferase [Rhodobacterales bacterium HKCCE4037]|nr:peptide chain release factor N(5)-glutamine methyltransferase [Rhodobacterales bacterium HKCCE4037]